MRENRKYLKEITDTHYDSLKLMHNNIKNGSYACKDISCDDCPFTASNDIYLNPCSSYDNIKGADWDEMSHKEKIDLINYMLANTDYAEINRITPIMDVNSLKNDSKTNKNQWLENYIKQRLKPVKFVVGEDNYSIMWDLSNHSFKAMKANYSKHFLQVHFDNRKGQVEQACRDFNDKSIKPQQIIDVFKKLNYFKEEM